MHLSLWLCNVHPIGGESQKEGPINFVSLASEGFSFQWEALCYSLLKQLGTTNIFIEESILILESQLLGHGSLGTTFSHKQPMNLQEV